jgi:HSP20 family protein
MQRYQEEIMELVQMDPFSMLRDIERMFDRTSTTPQRWLPRIDVFDREKELVVRVEIAGVDPDDVDVTVEDRTLTISGSRSLDETTEGNGFHRREIFSGEFRRSLVLPEGLDAGEITAKADKGIIEVTIPRKPEVLPRKVKVDVSK